VDAAIEGARLRLRPILMTSFAFIFGSVPLAIATGAGSGARLVLGHCGGIRHERRHHDRHLHHSGVLRVGAEPAGAHTRQAAVATETPP